MSLPRSATEGLRRWILPEILHPNGLLIGPVTWTLIYLFLIFCQHTPVNLVCRLNHHCYPVATQLLPKQILKLHHKSINHWTATLPGCYPERYSQFKPLLYMYSCNFHVVWIVYEPCSPIILAPKHLNFSPWRGLLWKSPHISSVEQCSINRFPFSTWSVRKK